MNWLRLVSILLAGVLAFYPVVRTPTLGLLVIAGIALILVVAGTIGRQYRLFAKASGFILLEYCLILVGRSGALTGAEAILTGLGIFVMLELSYLACLFPPRAPMVVAANILLFILVRAIGTGFASVLFFLGFLMLSRYTIVSGNLFFLMMVLSASVLGLCIILLLQNRVGPMVDK